MNPVEIENNDIILRVYTQPKASRDQIVGCHNNELKIAITAPPVDGKANQHLIKFLAKHFAVAKTAIDIEKGQTSRHKQIRIKNIHIQSASIQQLLAMT